jgi:hypothetical protein
VAVGPAIERPVAGVVVGARFDWRPVVQANAVRFPNHLRSIRVHQCPGEEGKIDGASKTRYSGILQIIVEADNGPNT